jgi:hypothetical protein
MFAQNVGHRDDGEKNSAGAFFVLLAGVSITARVSKKKYSAEKKKIVKTKMGEASPALNS